MSLDRSAVLDHDAPVRSLGSASLRRLDGVDPPGARRADIVQIGWVAGIHDADAVRVQDM